MSLSNARLYLILDRDVNSYEELLDIAREAISAGVDIIQLRDKSGSDKEILEFAQRLKKLTGTRVPFIINDRIDLAKTAGASGVHLGQDDVSLAKARAFLGPEAIIGVSCQTLAHVRKAVKDGADYIGFGSVFKTLTKPERRPMDLRLLAKAAGAGGIPVFAIGGIDLENIAWVRSAGVNRVAVCRSICTAKDHREATRTFKEKLDAAYN